MIIVKVFSLFFCNHFKIFLAFSPKFSVEILLTSTIKINVIETCLYYRKLFPAAAFPANCRAHHLRQKTQVEPEVFLPLCCSKLYAYS